MVEIKRQKNRDMCLYYRYNNEALKNIERDNKRQLFIKRLLSEEILPEVWIQFKNIISMVTWRWLWSVFFSKSDSKLYLYFI